MSFGNSISETVPIWTPTRRTGDPSARPLVLSNWLQYFTLRENSLCSLLIAMTPRPKRMRPIDTNAPTLISLATLDSRIGASPPTAQEVPQPGCIRVPRFLHGPDEIHLSLVQVADPVTDEERAVDVMRHDHRGDCEPVLKAANQ